MSNKRSSSPPPSTPPKRLTRSDTDHYLIGQATPNLTGCKLPTLQEVLQYLLYTKSVYTTPTYTNRFCFSIVCDDVVVYWRMAKIKTITDINCVKRLENVWKQYQLLTKTQSRPGDPGNKKKNFIESLPKLWDIGAPDVVEVIMANRLLSSEKKNEDIKFYLDQQTNRISTMSGGDKVFSKKAIDQYTRQQRSYKPMEDLSSSQLSSASESVSSVCSMEEEPGSDFQEENASTSQAAAREEFVTLLAPRKIMECEEIALTLDRLKISDNAGTMLLSSFITACNGNLDKFTISRSTTRRNRNAIRHGISLEILETYRESPPKFAALHWDGKLTKDRLGEVYDALSVIASGAPKYVEGKLLGVQRIKNATGKAQAEATFELIELWNLKQNITSLVFDTTASNSGWKSGAAKILEEKLERKVFYLACRHHVYELVIGAVWKRLFGKSSGPETPLFNQFKTAWKTLDKSQPISTVTISDPWLLERKSVVIDELEEVLRFPGKDSKRVFPRADYRECTENTLTVLAHDPPQGRRNHKPGATHSARWMGQMLYAQKMFLWSDQMQYEATVLDQLHRLNVFIAIFYTSAWMKTSFGADAPVNDLNFIKDMIRFQQIDEDVGKAAFNAIYKHRWYLTEELVVFSLFSSIATEDLKRKMADKLLSLETGESFRLGRPPFQCISAETNLEDLIGSESLYLFTTLGITTEWLGLPVSHWVDNDEYVVASEFVHSVKVVNDAAERGVKLSTECSAIITDDPEQRRWLLQAIEKHRGIYPDFKKATLQKKL